MELEYKFFAFISYNSKDIKWGKRLQRKLEGYRMPATLCSQYGWQKHPMKPVFFAPTDIQPGVLTSELQERLRNSKHLIVICSPNSASSEWVGMEISFFCQLGRTDNIHFFIVDGVPNSGDVKTECFNPVVKELGLPEILGANINEKIFKWSWLNTERAYIQLISRLLGVEFDAIWQRHRRLLIEKLSVCLTMILAIAVSLISVWEYNRSVDVVAVLEDRISNEYLPPLSDAVFTLYLGEEKKIDTLETISSRLCFHHIPHHFIGKNVHIEVNCANYQKVDTNIILRKEICLPIIRKPEIYGNVKFGVWDMKAGRMVAGLNVVVDGIDVKSDDMGIVSLCIPIERQRTKYMISSDIPLEDSLIIMPCGNNDIVTLK